MADVAVLMEVVEFIHLWKFVYEFRPDQEGVNQIGLLNQLLVLVGLSPRQILLDEPWNTFLLIVVMIWIQAGFAMTILSAAIKAVPDDIVEAARLDGVGAFGMFRFVTLPMISPSVIVVPVDYRENVKLTKRLGQLIAR